MLRDSPSSEDWQVVMSKHHCQVMFLMLPLSRLIFYLPLYPVLLFHSHPMFS